MSSSENDISRRAAEELEKCAHCGKCRSVCPVFAELRDEAFVARGRVTLFEALSQGRISASPELHTIMSACLMCQRCREVCPSGVQFVEILLAARERLAREMGLPFGASLVFRHVLTRRRLFDFTMRAASFVQRVIPGRRKGSLRHLPLFFKGGKWLPSLAKETALRRFGATPPERRGGPVWPPGIGQAQGPAPTGAASRDQKNGGKKRVGVFVGCLTNYVYPEIIGACVELLRTAGMEVVVPDGQLCCGTPALAFGEIAAARRLARRNKRCFEDANCDFVVAVCASCGRTLKQEYLYLLDSGGATLGAPVLDVCEFVSKHTNLFFTRLTEKVIYHDPCHLRWGQGVMAEPRSLLARSCAFEEIAGDMTCCGQAGTFHVFYPEIAQMLGRRKVDSLSASDASVVATGCPGCILQLNDLMAGAGNGKRALHTVEILARAVRGGGKSFGDPEGVQKGGGGTPSWVAG